MNKPLDDYKVGDLVEIFTCDASCLNNEHRWIEGIVTETGIYTEYGINFTKRHPKVKVKYLRTYWNSDTDLLYENENEEWFYYDTEIKLKQEYK